LRLSFQDASKNNTAHKIEFKPDADLINILCVSTLAQEPLPLDIDRIDQAFLETSMRDFASEFLGRLRYPSYKGAAV
jgi:hypothetical protein